MVSPGKCSLKCWVNSTSFVNVGGYPLAGPPYLLVEAPFFLMKNHYVYWLNHQCYWFFLWFNQHFCGHMFSQLLWPRPKQTTFRQATCCPTIGSQPQPTQRCKPSWIPQKNDRSWGYKNAHSMGSMVFFQRWSYCSRKKKMTGWWFQAFFIVHT